MKNTLILLSVLVSCVLLQAQSPFMRAIGTTGDDFANSIEPTSDGGFIVAGYTSGSGAGGQDVLLVKLDASGAIQWAKTAGGTINDTAFHVRQSSDAGYIATGQTNSVTGVGQVLLTKFDGNGTIQWTSTLGNSSDSAAGFSVQQTNDGGYVVTGFPGGAIGGLGLLKYSAAGQLEWLRRAQGTNLYGNSVQQTSDGGYVVAGSQQIGGGNDVVLLKFDGSGNLQWAQLAGSTHDSANSVRQTSDGGYIVAGATASFGAGGQDALLLKYDSSGTLQWARIVGGSGDEAADSVRQTSDSGYIVSGHTSSFGGSGTVVLLLKFDSSGTLQWARAGGGSTGGTAVQQTSDGNYMVAASTASFGAGGVDLLLIRTDANGNIAGCSDWSSVNPSIDTTTFPSAAMLYTIDSPTFSVGAPTFSVDTPSLTSSDQCTVSGSPIIGVSPLQITFPTTVVNTISSPVQITVSNTGTANLVISGISTQDPFAISNFSSGITSSIAPKTQGTFDVLFRPKIQGTSFGAIKIESNAANLPSVNISLVGNSSPPPLPTGSKRVFVFWTAGQVLQFVLVKETNTTASTQVQFALANLQPTWYDVSVSTVGGVSGSLPRSFVLAPNQVKSDFSTITFSSGTSLRFTADRTTNRALMMLGMDLTSRLLLGSALPTTEVSFALTLLSQQNAGAAYFLGLGRDILAKDLVAVSSDLLKAIGNKDVLNILRALGLVTGQTNLPLKLITGVEAAFAFEIATLNTPVADELFVTATK